MKTTFSLLFYLKKPKIQQNGLVAIYIQQEMEQGRKQDRSLGIGGGWGMS